MEKEAAFLALFRENETFQHLPASDLKALTAVSERKYYNRNQVVFSTDQKGRYFYLVEAGSFLLSLLNNKTKVFNRGALFGEIAVINENVRTGTIRARENATLMAVNSNLLFDAQYTSPEIALRVVRALAKNVTNYLRSREEVSTEELIAQGENEYVEFKSSLRWNSQTKNKGKLVEHAVLKAIAGFLNTKGGVVLVGVNDEQQIVGLKHDDFENDDKMLLHLTRLIKEYISPLHKKFVDFHVEHFEQGAVLRIDCEPATLPAYLRAKDGEVFYLRIGPSTNKLAVSKIYDYICMRFFPNEIRLREFAEEPFTPSHDPPE